jgi:hypothetical protein
MLKIFLISLFVIFQTILLMAQDSNQCVEISGGGEMGDTDVALDDGDCSTNFVSWHELVALCWASGGQPIIDRSLIKFDLQQIPNSSNILSANLKLYKHPAPTSANGTSFNGDCSFYIQRVQELWYPNSVTWCNQPSTDSSNQILINCDSFINLDSLSVDVTSMINNMFSNPQNNFGFLIKMKTELPYNSATFTSQNYPEQSLIPKLNVCYSTITKIKNEESTFKNNFSISHNNSNSKIDFVFKAPTNCIVSIYSLNSSKIFETQQNSSFSLDLPLEKGMFICQIRDLNLNNEANFKLFLK